MDDHEAFKIVSGARDDVNHPDGNIFNALTELEKRYKSNRTKQVEELEGKWEKQRILRKGSNPTKLFDNLSAIKNN